MISDFRLSENKEGFFEVIADTFMSIQMMLFELLDFISLIVFSNIFSGLNFSASKMLLIQSGSELMSKDVIANGFVAEEAIIFR